MPNQSQSAHKKTANKIQYSQKKLTCENKAHSQQNLIDDRKVFYRQKKKFRNSQFRHLQVGDHGRVVVRVVALWSLELASCGIALQPQLLHLGGGRGFHLYWILGICKRQTYEE